MHSSDGEIPRAPSISEELLGECRRAGEFRPILFEWYKFVAHLACFLAGIGSESPAVRLLPKFHYASLIGLLNRIGRLMAANVTLSRDGLFGETTAIIDRCVFESCIKVSWLCEATQTDRFDRFLFDGSEADLELRREIHASIQKRGGVVQKIEKRMLQSIEGRLTEVGIPFDSPSTSKKLPDLASMVSAVGHNRLAYVVGQRMGSHSVHGRWPSIRKQYLDENGAGTLVPRDHDCETHVNQYMFVPMAALDSLRSFVGFLVTAKEEADPLLQVIDETEKAILQVIHEVVGEDFENVANV